MKHILLASTSTLHGQTYLSYLQPALKTFFAGVEEVVFIPYARPGGISHDEYTARATEAFGIRLKGLHGFDNPAQAIHDAQAFFTGGGNTFLLVKQLWELGLMHPLKEAVESGKPYLGTSAGSNIAGVSMQTTNDMPIVYPPSFKTLGLVPFNLNPHYLDPIPGSQHMGETRETRIQEFHTQNSIPVIGLREGGWISVNGADISLQGSPAARIFEQGKAPYELPAGSGIPSFGC